MCEEILRKLASQVRTWGRWGPDDEIGTRTYPPTKPNDPIIEGHLLTAA